MFEAHLRSVLLASPEIAAITKTIVPLQASATTTLPFIIYTIDNENDPLPSLDGPSELFQQGYTLYLNCISYEQVIDLMRKIRRKLDDFYDSEIVFNQFDDTADVISDVDNGSENPIYIRSISYNAFIRL